MKSSPPFWQGLRKKAGLDSIRGRFLYTVLIVSTFLGGASFLGWLYVEKNTTGQIANIQHRALASDAVNELILQIHTLEINLQRFNIFPKKEKQLKVEQSMKLQLAALKRLTESHWVGHREAMVRLVEDVVRNTNSLHQTIQELMVVRSNVEQWFPAMELMQSDMLPLNVEFQDFNNIAIEESSLEVEPERYGQHYELLSDLRFTFLRMVSEFRLFVANRFGIFASNPEQGMLTRAENIDIYSEHITELLSNIRDLIGGEYSDSEYVKALDVMEQAHENWSYAYGNVMSILSSPNWRLDLLIMDEKVKPLFSLVRQRLSVLQLELDVASARDITNLTKIAKRLSDSFIYVAIGLILVILFTYAVFHQTLLHPIAQIALALKSVTKGEQGIVIPKTRLRETRNLTLAFRQMHAQVQIRQSRLDYMAHHDSLTKLPNRILFRDRLAHALSNAHRENNLVGLMFLDLDRFKQINDTLGHDIGDRLLQAVSDRVCNAVRESDTVARLGGDEFAIVLEGTTQSDQVAIIAQKIIDTFVSPFRVGRHNLHITTSIGISLYPVDETHVDALIKQADTAMYCSKNQGRNLFRFYSAEMSVRVTEQMDLENELRNAIRRKEFLLYYQPIIDMKTGIVSGVETLLRWQHPKRGLLAPGDFLSVLEDSRLISPVTQWITVEACKQLAYWIRTGAQLNSISVNMSGRLLQDKKVYETIVNLLDSNSFLANKLTLEITEDTLIHDFKSVHSALSELKNKGVKIALDDFGTGQSSLSHLRNFPIDIVKIDRDFIRDTPQDQYDSELVAAIIAMARNLQIKVVAEGVETDEQLQFLEDYRCQYAQGFLLGRPMSASKLAKLIGSPANVVRLVT